MTTGKHFDPPGVAAPYQQDGGGCDQGGSSRSPGFDQGSGGGDNNGGGGGSGGYDQGGGGGGQSPSAQRQNDGAEVEAQRRAQGDTKPASHSGHSASVLSRRPVALLTTSILFVRLQRSCGRSWSG